METPARYGPDDTVPRDQLIPATVVQRHTSPATTTRGKVDLRVPCCGRWARVQPNDSDAFSLLACTSCRLVFEIDLVNQRAGCGDDQPRYLAHLTVLDVASVTVAVRRHTPHRRRYA
jgi:hypothetical protein